MDAMTHQGHALPRGAAAAHRPLALPAPAPAEPTAREVWEEAIRRAREEADDRFAIALAPRRPVAHSWPHYLAARSAALLRGESCLLHPPSGRYRPVVVQAPPWSSLFREQLAVQEAWVRQYYPQHASQILPLIAYF